MPRVFTQTFGVVAAFIEREGKFLLVKEKHPGLDFGKWNHPAGWIDLGEDPVAAVRRETREETGYLFEPTDLLGVYSLAKKYKAAEHGGALPHGIKLVFLGRLGEKVSEPMADEISATRWFSAEEIEKLDSSELRDADIKIMLREYLAGRRYPLDSVHHSIQE
ncbi:MAG: NUDIX domain-containing protein [Patescibacteria group bacterium]